MTARVRRSPSRSQRNLRGGQTPSLALPARYYVDGVIYEKEKRLIFYNSWQMICHISDVKNAGDFSVGWVADQGVIVIRGKDGVLRGFHNVCAHRAHELLQGKGNTRSIVCPYHAWVYELDGVLKTARHSSDVPCFDGSRVRLKAIKTDIFCGLVFVNLDVSAASLHSQTFKMEESIRRFIPKIDSLKHAHQVTYNVHANWKTIVDNYLECYHCVVAHPKFNQTFDIASWKHTNYTIHTIQGKIENDEPALDGKPRYTSQSAWWLWPNLFIPRFPAEDSDSLMVCRNIPRSPEETTQVWDFYFESEEPSPAQQEAIRWLDQVAGKEDLGLVESVQRGLHSLGYQPGQLMIDPHHAAGWSEHGVWHFQQMVRQRLGAARGQHKKVHPRT